MTALPWSVEIRDGGQVLLAWQGLATDGAAAESAALGALEAICSAGDFDLTYEEVRPEAMPAGKAASLDENWCLSDGLAKRLRESRAIHAYTARQRDALRSLTRAEAARLEASGACGSVEYTCVRSRVGGLRKHDNALQFFGEGEPTDRRARNRASAKAFAFIAVIEDVVQLESHDDDTFGSSTCDPPGSATLRAARRRKLDSQVEREVRNACAILWDLRAGAIANALADEYEVEQ